MEPDDGALHSAALRELKRNQMNEELRRRQLFEQAMFVVQDEWAPQQGKYGYFAPYPPNVNVSYVSLMRKLFRWKENINVTCVNLEL